MKNYLLLLGISLSVSISSCQPKNNTEDIINDSSVIPKIEGQAYLQPLDKIISLSFATSKTTVFFNFVDSIYCNVTINSAVGNIVQSRKYLIDSNRVLTLFNPINDKRVAFKLSINTDTTILLRDVNGADIYKLIPCDNQVNMLLISDNLLKKQEFLYPTLTEKEREFGVENQYKETTSDRVITQTHPLQHEVRKINIYKLF